MNTKQLIDELLETAYESGWIAGAIEKSKSPIIEEQLHQYDERQLVVIEHRSYLKKMLLNAIEGK